MKRLFVVEVVRSDNVGGYWWSAEGPNIWDALPIDYFPEDVNIDQEYEMTLVRVK